MCHGLSCNCHDESRHCFRVCNCLMCCVMTLLQAIAACSRLTWLQLATPMTSGLASTSQVSAAGCPSEQAAAS